MKNYLKLKTGRKKKTNGAEGGEKINLANF